ncbi:MAG: purine-nucleoside phosphorylase [Halanaerobium sp.]|nr:purine-nucleoside phosphorylase [Halanaerobium sp.]
MPFHVKAEPDQVASFVILVGDPARATYIARRYLAQARRYNENRKLLGYTGEFAGQKVSVQTTGMGEASAAIVIQELLELGVKRLVRIGTCGALQEEVKSGDLILARAAATLDLTVNRLAGGLYLAPLADYELITELNRQAVKQGLELHLGQVATVGFFHGTTMEQNRLLAENGVLAREMETAILYILAARAGVSAASLLIAGGHVFKRERAEQCQIRKGVDRAVKLCLQANSKGAG